MRLRYNLLETTLGASLTNVATSVTFAAALQEGGVNIPTIAAPDYLPLTIGGTEVVWLTAYTAGATSGTIVREPAGESQDGIAHSSGETVSNNPTKQDFNYLRYSSGAAPDLTLAVEDGALFVAEADGDGTGTESIALADGTAAVVYLFGESGGEARVIVGGPPGFAVAGAYATDAGSVAQALVGGFMGFVFGYTTAYDGGYSAVYGNRGFAFGYAYSDGAGNSAGVLADGLASFVGGYAKGGLISSNSSARGGFAFGYAHAEAGVELAVIKTSWRGAFACGYAGSDGVGTAKIEAASLGSFALGAVYAAGASSTADLFAESSVAGAFAGGYAKAEAGNSALVSASDFGAFAFGYAHAVTNDALVGASGKGSAAMGYAVSAETISATADGAFQWGVGVNDLAASLRVGLGPWLVGTIGAPASPQDGQMWVDGSGHVLVRTGGVTKDMSNI